MINIVMFTRIFLFLSGKIPIFIENNKNKNNKKNNTHNSLVNNSFNDNVRSYGS